MQKHPQIKLSSHAKQELTQLDVAAVYLFGSRASGAASPGSDFDFAILLENPKRVANGSSKLYDDLYKILSSATHPETLGADVIDIVFLDSPRVPLELKFHVVKNGKVLFDRRPVLRGNFEALTVLKTADFAPLRNMMSTALLARI